jgi:hypothetical protein
VGAAATVPGGVLAVLVFDTVSARGGSAGDGSAGGGAVPAGAWRTLRPVRARGPSMEHGGHRARRGSCDWLGPSPESGQGGGRGCSRGAASEGQTTCHRRPGRCAGARHWRRAHADSAGGPCSGEGTGRAVRPRACRRWVNILVFLSSCFFAGPVATRCAQFGRGHADGGVARPWSVVRALVGDLRRKPCTTMSVRLAATLSSAITSFEASMYRSPVYGCSLSLSSW